MGGRRGRGNTLERVSGSTSHMALLAMLQRLRILLAGRQCLVAYVQMTDESEIRDLSAKTIRY